MRPSRTSLAMVVALAGCFAVGYGLHGIQPALLPAAQADIGIGNSGKCSSVTLKGSYGIKFEGVSLKSGQFASISRIVFDGVNTFSTHEIGSLNGELVERNFTGPYTVRDDCTGFLDFSSTLTVPHEVHGDFVIIDQGKGFYVVDSEEGWVANGVGTRQ
jgi:hypothetical protein